MNLDDIALKYNTDKSSKWHNYVERYEAHFSSIRNQPLKILEIGIQNGYSLKTWKEYFPNAHIYGVDIVDCKHMDEDRVTTLMGSQNDVTFLAATHAQYGPFDIIIDDGSHYNNDMLISFNTLFPLLKQGGLYVVEDLHCCYWPEFNDGNTAFMDRLKELLDLVNTNGKCGLGSAKNSDQDHVYQQKTYGTMDWWEQNLDSIHLYRSIVFIKKGVYGNPSDQPEIQTKAPNALFHIKRFAHRVIRRVATKAGITINTLKSMKHILKKSASAQEIKDYQKKTDVKIYDCFVFFNELELLDIRLNILDPYVDHFVIVEATKTFNGASKPLYFQENRSMFKKFEQKIIHIIVDDMPDSFEELKNRLVTANSLDKTIINNCLTTDNVPVGEVHWLREFYQKEQIKKGLQNCKEVDVCYVSDVDEIWNPDRIIDTRNNDIFKFEQYVYSYYLNNRSSEHWYGTFATTYKTVAMNSINHLDSPSKTAYVYVKNGGWHFTNQGGLDQVIKKLESYGHQEFNTPEIKSDLKNKLALNKDFIGRNFTFWIDDSDLPNYLKTNRTNYASLFKDGIS